MKLASKRSVPEKKKPDIFVRGYAPSRRLVERNGRFNRSCYNCDYYYKAPGDDEEVCQNEQVLSYDMYVSENNVVCSMWRQSSRRTDAKTLFKRGY